MPSASNGAQKLYARPRKRRCAEEHGKQVHAGVKSEAFLEAYHPILVQHLGPSDRLNLDILPDDVIRGIKLEFMRISDSFSFSRQGLEALILEDLSKWDEMPVTRNGVYYSTEGRRRELRASGLDLIASGYKLDRDRLIENFIIRSTDHVIPFHSAFVCFMRDVFRWAYSHGRHVGDHEAWSSHWRVYNAADRLWRKLDSSARASYGEVEEEVCVLFARRYPWCDAAFLPPARLCRDAPTQKRFQLQTKVLFVLRKARWDALCKLGLSQPLHMDWEKRETGDINLETVIPPTDIAHDAPGNPPSSVSFLPPFDPMVPSRDSADSDQGSAHSPWSSMPSSGKHKERSSLRAYIPFAPTTTSSQTPVLSNALRLELNSDIGPSTEIAASREEYSTDPCEASFANEGTHGIQQVRFAKVQLTDAVLSPVTALLSDVDVSAVPQPVVDSALEPVHPWSLLSASAMVPEYRADLYLPDFGYIDDSAPPPTGKTVQAPLADEDDPYDHERNIPHLMSFSRGPVEAEYLLPQLRVDDELVP